MYHHCSFCDFLTGEYRNGDLLARWTSVNKIILSRGLPTNEVIGGDHATGCDVNSCRHRLRMPEWCLCHLRTWTVSLLVSRNSIISVAHL